MEKFKAFQDWLIARQDISKSTRLANLEIIDKALNVKDFEKIKSPSILQRLIAEFKSNRHFLAKPRLEKTGILASFALYMTFIEEQAKENKNADADAVG